MTTRDELAALIYPYFGTPDRDIDALNAADAILAAYRVEKREPPKHWPANAPGLVVCALCGEHWPCHTYLVEHGPNRTGALPCLMCGEPSILGGFCEVHG